MTNPQENVVWITGASSGIGKSMAFEWAKLGYKVVLSARRKELLEEIVLEIENSGGEAFVVPVDIMEEKSIENAVQSIIDKWGRIDVAVANAGFGVFGILGIVCIVVGLAMSLILNDFFDLSVSGSEKITQAFLLVLISLIVSIGASVFFGGSLLKSKAFKKISLNDEQTSQSGYQIHKPQLSLIGKNGKSITDLRPSGKVEINGERFEALSIDGFIENGTEVVVTKIENYNLSVKRA
mgnify:CR=1 FL=1